MWRTARPPLLALIAAITLSVSNGRPDAQQQTIKRTDLLKLDLAEMNGSEMNVWVADIAPGAQTGRHSHPTPRFVYVSEGAVVLELDGRSSQMFKAGEAFAEIPNAIHNLKNASTTDGARALGFQYAQKGHALQVNAP
jgi:quercetin dioxygenase-like cupin family protein